MSDERRSLAGKVAVVAGATRRAGRGIAVELGIAGATVYCTGRTTREQRSDRSEPGSIEETAALVEAYGGKAVWARVDHTDVPAVQALFDRVVAEQGRLDLVVNSIAGNATNDPFLSSDLASNVAAVCRGGSAHVVTAHVAAKKMVELGSGLIVGLSDHEWDQFYALEKTILNRLPMCVAEELRPHGVAIVSLLPGAFFKFFDVTTAEEMQEVVRLDPDALRCHTPRLIGRGVVALAADPQVMAKSGKVLELHDLVPEYGLADIDGRQSGEWW